MMGKRVRLVQLLGMSVILLFACSNTDDVEEQDSAAVETSESKIENEEKRVSFMGVGDNLIHIPVFNYARFGEGQYDFKPIYAPIAEDIENTDLTFVNQETMFAGDHLPYSGYPQFNSPSDLGRDLVDMGFNLINLSNNHTLDYGADGLYNTLNYTSGYESRALFTGVYQNQEERDTIPVFEKNGITFSLLSYTYGTNVEEPEKPYLVNYFDPELIRQDVERAEEISDFVMVSAHWGTEYVHHADDFQKGYAQYFADLGVDVVLGTHSHTIQPVEWVTGEEGNETLVVYSLGNFLAAQNYDFGILGGSIHFNFVKNGEEKSIENVEWKPLVIHYEEAQPTSIGSRTSFAVHYLENYSNELAQKHGLNNYDYEITVENLYQRNNSVISPEFMSAF